MFRTIKLNSVLILGLFGISALQAKSIPLRYAVIGDSYSIGQSVRVNDRWPDQLAARLAGEGIALQIVSNPSHTGWTSVDALQREVPLFRAARPDFATLQIGVNDWVQGASPDAFRENLGKLMDAMLKELKAPKKCLVVNIPDFSASPTGGRYSGGRNISQGIRQFNAIILDEAEKRRLPVVDIFGLSQQAKGRPDLAAKDGLHPSAKEYAAWVDLIFPEAKKLLKAR